MSLLRDGEPLPLEVHLVRVWLVDGFECTLDCHRQKKAQNKHKPTSYILLETNLCETVKKQQ